MERNSTLFENDIPNYFFEKVINSASNKSTDNNSKPATKII